MTDIWGNRVALVLTAIVAAFVLIAALGGFGGGGSNAGSFPGVVTQSGEVATDQGLSVQLDHATFSGTAVVLRLLVRTEDAELGPAGIELTQSTLAGVAPERARNHSDGRTVVTFPPEAWPKDVPTALLTIGGVRVMDPVAGLRTVEGNWELTVSLPEGDDAEAASAVEALPPVEVEIAGHTATVETFRTETETLVRYNPPVNAFSWSPPQLKAGDQVLEPLRADQRSQSIYEVLFEATPAGVPLTLLFDEFVVADPEGRGWTVDLRVAPFDPPGTDDHEVYSLDWEVSGGTNAPDVMDLTWQRREDLEVHLTLTVTGMWDSGGTKPPLVRGDGESLRVVHTGIRPSDNPLGPHSIITTRLWDPEPPRELSVTFGGGTIAVPPMEVELRP